MQKSENFEKSHNKPINAMTIELRESIVSALEINGINVNQNDIIDIREKAIRLLDKNGIEINENASLYEIYEACKVLNAQPAIAA